MNLFNFISRIVIAVVGVCVILLQKPHLAQTEPVVQIQVESKITQPSSAEPAELVFNISETAYLDHPGGEQLDHSLVSKITSEVVSNLELVPQTPEFKHLVFETMIVETLMGKSNYIRAAKRNNFGIAQIRPETAKDVLKNIKKKNINDYYYIISLKNSNLSLKQNLLSNVHFSIAICAEFYALKKIKRLDSKHLRAQVWKRFYNTKKGSGTVDAYVKRVTNYYASL